MGKGTGMRGLNKYKEEKLGVGREAPGLKKFEVGLGAERIQVLSEPRDQETLWYANRHHRLLRELTWGWGGLPWKSLREMARLRI